MSEIKDLYTQIRDDNLKKYGTAVDEYGPVLLADLYKDKTHFIYELIQNAEDACQRAKKKGLCDSFYLDFKLYKNRIEVRHNGIPFEVTNETNDIVGICGIVAGTKSKDKEQIGKFGIGFKSVYAYTNKPAIYSGKYNFYIENYVSPYPILSENIPEISENETLFIIPFDKESKNKEISFNEILKELKKIYLSLLFLKNIKKITWTAKNGNKNISGCYEKEISPLDDNLELISLKEQSTEEENDKKSEFLIFHKDIADNQKVEIAYKLIDEKDINEKNITRISKIKNAKLFSFLPTDKETDFNFIINGPFETNPNREDIKKNDFNNNLIIEIGNLVVESIPKIKDLNLLKTNFLSLLPINSEIFSEDNQFYPVYKILKEYFLSGSEILPTLDGNYVKYSAALLGSSKDLINLLGSEQLESLLDKRNCKWLDSNITPDKNSVLRKYLMQELEIPEITPDKFARELNEEFLSHQSDDWMIKFYTFLLDQKALWKKKAYSWSTEGILLSKKFIRLEDNTHVKPFNVDYTEVNAYLPSEFTKYFPTVKQVIFDDENAQKFLKNLGIPNANADNYIRKKILPKYSKADTPSKKENIEDIKFIDITLQKYKKEGRTIDNIIKKINEVPLLLGYNIVLGKEKYCCSNNIYNLDKNDESNPQLVFFQDNPNIYYLSDIYKKNISDSFFDLIGLKKNISIFYRGHNRYITHITIIDRDRRHERGLNGFDPDFSIEGLKFALKNITIEKSKIIWDLVLNYCQTIKGTVEKSTRKDFSAAEKEESFSIVGKLLIKYAWIPDKKGIFFKPADITKKDISEELNLEHPSANSLIETLGLKTDIDAEILEQLPENKKEKFKLLIQADDEMWNDIWKLYKKRRLNDNDLNLSESENKIREKFRESLSGDSKTPSDTTLQKNDDDINLDINTDLSPEDEETIKKNYGNNIGERIIKLVKKSKINIENKTIVRDSIDPKEYLYSEYKGHCQICYTKIDLGTNKKPYFEIFRIFETKNKYSWSNSEFNILCLCPNCWALLKHSVGVNLSNILSYAQKYNLNELPLEDVSERMGSYYCVPVIVNKIEKVIYYSQNHMAKVGGFLLDSY